MMDAREPDSHSFKAERAWSVVAGTDAGETRIKGALYLVDLHADPADIPVLGAMLDEEERCRAARFHFEEDRLRYIAGRARLRQCLAVSLGIHPVGIRFQYGLRGKPQLSDIHASSLHFNLSHSGSWGLIGVTREHAIGVDIEEKVPLTAMDDIATRFFSRDEYSFCQAGAEEDRVDVFYDCWTRKEAFAKALGKGLFLLGQSFDVPLGRDGPILPRRIDGVSGERGDWLCAGFDPLPGFRAAVVVSGCEPHVAVLASE